LHPPKKPENLRTEHLPRINVPTLCISGTKDNFGSPEELESAFSVVPAQVQWHWVQNGRHELAKADAEIAATVLQFIQTV
jgi:predicted alpha/beta-hydrolase family hydrolase